MTPDATHQPHLPPLRVLLVEDNPADAELVRIELGKTSRPHFELTHFPRLEDALASAAEVTYDVMLLDLSLPDAYGRQTIVSAVTACPALPIIALTGIGDEGLEMSVVRAGAQDYMNKHDISCKTLIRVIRHAIERRKAAEERECLERRVAAAQKLESLGVIADGIAHEFNNLLFAILGNTEFALMDLPEKSPLRTTLQEIELACRSAALLTRQLAAYAGQSSFAFDRVHLSSVVSEMAGSLQSAGTINTTVVYEAGGSESDDTWVEIDIGQIRQAVLNLVHNAAEANHDDDAVITIRTGLTHVDREGLADASVEGDLFAGDYACIEVVDAGCGIDPDSLKRIFDPFYSTKFAGRGLGLAAALGIVKGHGGAISVASQTGAGTTISILLPLSATPSLARSNAEVVEEPIAANGGAVLVVDDDEAVRRIAITMLSRAGFEVLAAESGPEAVSIYGRRSRDIGAVIVDLTMAGMDGEETFEALRRLRADLPVVFCSGRSDERDRLVQGRERVAFAQKPFRASDLTEKLREAQVPSEV